MSGERKRVRVTIELSQSFLRLLNANVSLNGGIVSDRPLTAHAVLTRVVLAEARGATEEQVHLIIPPEWRPDIEAVHAERRVIEPAAAEGER